MIGTNFGLSLGAILVILTVVVTKSIDVSESAVSGDAVGDAFKVLDQFYDNNTGFYNSIEDWHNANILEQTANWIDLNGGVDPDGREAIIEKMYLEQSVNRTCSGGMYNDDILWFVLGWVRAYEVIGREEYLERAKDLFSCVVGSWDDVCRGGVYWNDWRQYKNSVTNSLFVLAAGKLGEMGWYDRGLVWWLGSGVLGGDYLVYDGLNSSCVNNRNTVWTYNQGLGLGFLGKEMGGRVFNASRSYFDLSKGGEGSGVMTELCEVGSTRCDPPCSGGCDFDQQQFKGIFMRYLGYSGLKGGEEYVQMNLAGLFGAYNASLGEYGLSWTGARGLCGVNFVTQSSAIDLLLVGRQMGII